MLESSQPSSHRSSGESEKSQGRQRLTAGKLRRERRARNVTETEESYVVQYLVLGGHRHYTTLGKEKVTASPWLAASGVHAGAGRQVFGWSEQQRCDLLLAFLEEEEEEEEQQQQQARQKREEKKPVRLYFHNHHGSPWHYYGHLPGCPLRSHGNFGGGGLVLLDRLVEKPESALEDDFRRGLAEALSEVAPQRVLFFYTTSNSCQLDHGMPVPGLGPSSSSKKKKTWEASDVATCRSAKDCLLQLSLLSSPSSFSCSSSSSPPADVQKLAEACWLPSSKEFWEPSDLVRSIAQGRATGFVTLIGGRESDETVEDDPAGHRFGFCVQKYAPSKQDLGEFTLDQISNYYGWSWRQDPGGEKKLSDYLLKLEGRTLCASSLLSEETVSTTYLSWLMAARGFRDFKITHFLEYRFRDWAADFLEPVLQRRHDCKRAGNLVAAECLKLIGNGSYGYNGLEASNYADVKIMTDRALQKRYRSDMAHRRLQHVSFLGVIRVPASGEPSLKKNNKKKQQQQGERRKKKIGGLSSSHSSYIDREALDDDDDDDDDDADLLPEEEEDETDLTPSPSKTPCWSELHPCYYASDSDSDDDDDDDDDQEQWELSYARHRKRLPAAATTAADGTLKAKHQVVYGEEVDDDDDPISECLEEALVRNREEAEEDGERNKKRRRIKKVFRFLYAVTLSGEERHVSNSLPRAVAVLSNSKRLFLGHLECMFRCLDPRKAELCYVDTDSCIWSLSEKSLELCLRQDRAEEWNRAGIVADESGPRSCHGLMKLEGTYRSGIFRTVKMYRLFDETALAAAAQEEEHQQEDDDSDDEIEHRETSAAAAAAAAAAAEVGFLSSGVSQPYTRCKGIHRKTAEKLKDNVFFQTSEPFQVVVHRSALRPTRAGEIHLTRESKSLAVPFNLKRRVDSSGTHTVCFGLPNSSPPLPPSGQ